MLWIKWVVYWPVQKSKEPLVSGDLRAVRLWNRRQSISAINANAEVIAELVCSPWCSGYQWGVLRTRRQHHRGFQPDVRGERLHCAPGVWSLGLLLWNPSVRHPSNFKQSPAVHWIRGQCYVCQRWRKKPTVFGQDREDRYQVSFYERLMNVTIKIWKQCPIFLMFPEHYPINTIIILQLRKIIYEQIKHTVWQWKALQLHSGKVVG